MRTLYRTRYGIPVNLYNIVSFEYTPTFKIIVINMEAI